MKYDYKNNEFNINTKRSKKLITLMETKHQDTPDPYKFWLEKEINEQPISINRALGYGSRILDDNIINLGGLYENKDKLKNIENIVIVGCGTSYYAGLLGKYYFNELTNIKQVIVIDGSEICLYYIPYKNTSLLILSQLWDYTCDFIHIPKNCYSTRNFSKSNYLAGRWDGGMVGR